MAALAADRTFESHPTGRNQYEILVSDICYAGSLVGLSAAGFLHPWDDVATTVFVGVALEQAAGASASPAGTDTKCPVHDEGMIIKNIPIASAVQASVGLDVHCTTDNVLADCVLDGGATSRAIGRIIRWVSAADCDIQLYSAQEWQARYKQATT